jgi:hypothetical protein
MNTVISKVGDAIDRNDMLKADSYQELMEKIKLRLSKKYRASKIEWVWDIQKAWQNTDYDISDNGIWEPNYYKLFKKLEKTIQWKAEWLEKKYKFVRLSYHDFEAELWKITYEAIQYYESAGDIDTEFTLVETLEMYWKNRMNNYIKKCLYTEKHGWWHFSKSIPNYLHDTAHNPINPNPAIEKVEEIFSDESLTEKERKLLEAIYNNPVGSYREWGKEISVSHPETIRRLLNSLKNKLTKFHFTWKY